MSWLAPFYLLGALAIAAPIVFHLIRRTPKGNVPFSSLMFLTPTPPRITRRGKPENWLLLLLRASALILLALAFSRPFLRQADTLNFPDGGRKRLVVLVDASASMRRGDLWAKAKALADRTIADARADDQIAVYAFDSTTRPVLGFKESVGVDPARRRAIAASRLETSGPTWASTDLGRALVEAVGAVEDEADKTEKAGRMPRRVVLISDLQQGSKLEALGGFEWPSDVDLELKTVADPAPNAGPQLLANPADDAKPDAPIRVRVANEAGSGRESFRLAWVDEKGVVEAGPSTPVYVPPGESRVASVPRPNGPSKARSLRLEGDAQVFDNTLYLAADVEEEATVVYLGPGKPDDPENLLYYLNIVFEASPRRKVRVVAQAPTTPITWEPGHPPALVVVADELAPPASAPIARYLAEGGTILVVATAAAPGGQALAALAGSGPVAIAEAPAKDAMLGEIAFDHPLFAPLAGAQFGDFTKVRFWKHRKIEISGLGPAARVLARFEGGDPAVIEEPVGKGSLVVFASGWAPGDSQLARSSKFVPLMAALLERRAPRPVDSASFLVGDPVPLPEPDDRPRVVRSPDGRAVAVPSTATAFAATDRPGVYAIEAGGSVRPFAVNLDPAESRTAPLAVETLEQMGCRLAGRSAEVVDLERLRQLQNAELEGRQKLWRWLILAAIGILLIETILAGRISRPRSTRAEALAP